MQVFGNIGAGLGNIIGPYFIHYDSMIPGHNISEVPRDSNVTPEEMQSNISWYLASQASLLFLLFLAILIYFPSKPKVRLFVYSCYYSKSTYLLQLKFYWINKHYFYFILLDTSNCIVSSKTTKNWCCASRISETKKHFTLHHLIQYSLWCIWSLAMRHDPKF